MKCVNCSFAKVKINFKSNIINKDELQADNESLLG